MKYFSALIVLIGCSCFSIADVAIEEILNIPQEEIHIISKSKLQAKIDINENAIEINQDAIDQLLEAVNS